MVRGTSGQRGNGAVCRESERDGGVSALRDAEPQRVRPTLGTAEGRSDPDATDDAVGAQAALLLRDVQAAIH